MTLDVFPEYLDGASQGFLRNIYLNLNYLSEPRENGIEEMCIS